MLAASVASGQPDLDVILAGGRVMDPESQLDAIRNVGIREDSIVAISELSLASRRERGSLDLMLALQKMTIMPARRLESIAPAMKKKGRVQIGADADLVVFDPDTIIDTATYLSGLSYSKGIRHVFVSGTMVMRDGKLVEGQFPGKPLLGRVGNRESESTQR